MRRTVGGLLGVVLLVLSGCSSAPSSGSASASAPVAGAGAKYTCIAPSLGFGAAGMITIDIRRWSTDQERDTLKNTLVQGGEDKLLAALQNIRPPVGYISTPGTMGYDLYYARKNVLPNGDQHVVIATNRRVAMGEVASSTATMNYRFNLIELHLDSAGNGVGRMAPFSRVAWNAQLQKIEISDWSGDMPVDFEKVTARPN